MPGGSGKVTASAVSGAAGGEQPAVGDAVKPPSFKRGDGLVLRNVHLYLIYWGSAWLSDVSPTRAEVTAAVSTILAGGYTRGLAQYGALDQPTVVGNWVASASDPPSAFADSDVAGLIFDLIEAGSIPEPATDPWLVYVVFLPPGVRSVRSDVIGEHSYFTYLDLANAPAGAGLPLANAHYGWVSNDGTLDYVTTVFSHELAELITDPEGNGLTGEQGTCLEDGWCEIGDVCNRTEVLAGVRVQSYWSQEDGVCIVLAPGTERADQAPEAKPEDGPMPDGSGAQTVSLAKVTITSGQAPPKPGTGPSSSDRPSRPRWWTKFSAALTMAAPLAPMVAVVATVSAYLLPVDNALSLKPPSSVLVIGLLATALVWLVLGIAGSPLATARLANADEFGQLRVRVQQLRARLAGAAETPAPKGPDDARGVARVEAVQLLALLDRELADAGRTWVEGVGYIHAWIALHRAEEALFLLDSLESVIGEGLYDEMRLEGSQMANLDELLSKVRRAVSALSALAGHLYLSKEDLASAVSNPPPETADAELTARTVLRVARLTLNEYRDELWAGIVRARNKLLKTHFIAALGTYLLLVLLVLDKVDSKVVFAASVFFLFGGLVGFVGRLRDEASTDKGIEDFGLATARLITAPLLSGLAAIFGVMLVGLAHLKIGDLALGPAPASGSSFPLLTQIFSLGKNPAGFVAAALFGLTPALLINYLQSQTSKLNQALKSSEASGQTSG
jgi:hypothetical protein